MSACQAAKLEYFAEQVPRANKKNYVQKNFLEEIKGNIFYQNKIPSLLKLLKPFELKQLSLCTFFSHAGLPGMI